MSKKQNKQPLPTRNVGGFLRENSRFSLLDIATSEWGRGGLWREGVAWPNRTSRAANKIQSRFIFSSKSILYFHYTLIHITYLSTLVQFEFKEFRFMGKLKFFQIFIQKTTSDLNYVLPKIGIWEPNWFHVERFVGYTTYDLHFGLRGRLPSHSNSVVFQKTPMLTTVCECDDALV